MKARYQAKNPLQENARGEYQRLAFMPILSLCTLFFFYKQGKETFQPPLSLHLLLFFSIVLLFFILFFSQIFSLIMPMDSMLIKKMSVTMHGI